MKTKEEIHSAATEFAKKELGESQFNSNKLARIAIMDNFIAGAEFVANGQTKDEVTIIDLIMAEVSRATIKHPIWPADKVYAATVVAEENGELTRACLQFEAENGSKIAMKVEAIQTAATCIRFLQNL